MDEKKDIAVVYLVAGLSSRFGGRIKQFAKVGLNGETLIECSIDQAIKAGFTKIIFIVGDKTKDSFQEMFRDEFQGIPVKYAYQTFDQEARDKPWGTTEALLCAKEFLDCPFVVCNGDDIYGEKTFKILVNHINESNDSATIGYRLGEGLPEKGTTNRGIFHVNEQEYVEDIVETYNIEKSKLDERGLTSNTLCSMNIFVLQPSIINDLESIFEQFKIEHKDDRTSEAILAKDFPKLLRKGLLKIKLYSTPDKWLGVTNPEDEEIVKNKIKALSQKHPKPEHQD
jgi:dTDP-glucose pyrophosphorylase